MFANVLDGLTLFSLLLLIIGFVLVGIELTAPGISLPGISGILCLGIGVILIADTIEEGIMITLCILVILGIMLGIALWLLSKGKLVKPIILIDEQKKNEGYISSNSLEHLLGKEGIALTDLRPCGVGCFEEKSFDVMSDGQYILKGSEIMVCKVEGSKIVVKMKI